MNLKAGPVFLDFLNREASRSTGRERSDVADVHIMRTLAITLPHKFSANISQITEYCSERPNLFRLTLKFIESGIIDATSQAATIGEFIESRQILYKHVPDRYPFFFEHSGELERIKLGSRNDFDMTGLLGNRLLEYEPGKFPFILSRAFDNDKPNFDSGLDALKEKIFNRGSLAITRDLLVSKIGTRQLSPEQIKASARIISALYMQIYAEQRSLRLCTGIPDFAFAEIAEGFPTFDYQVLEGLIAQIAGRGAIGNFDLDEICAVYGSGEHQQFSYHAEAFLESSVNAVQSRANSLGALSALRALIGQFLLRELDVNPPISFKSVHDFFARANNILFERGNRTARENPLFGEKWRTYVPASNLTPILITTATDTEATALSSALEESGFARSNLLKAGRSFVQVYSRGHRDRIIHLRTSAGSLGAISAGSVLPDAVSALASRYVISAGICFGLKSEQHGHGNQRLGDVVIATYIQDYETKRQGNKRVIQRGERISAGQELLSAARILSENNSTRDWSIYAGLVLSGQKLIDNSNFVRRLQSEFPDAIAGEMEGNAVAGTCNFAGAQWILIKGICDWGMGKEDDFQEIAAKRACRLAVDAAIVILAHSQP